VLKDQQVLKVPQDLKEPLVQQVLWDLQDHKEELATQDWLVQPVLKEQQDHKVPQVLKDLQELKVLLDLWELPEDKVHKVL
jgi:hypothetical protein